LEKSSFEKIQGELGARIKGGGGLSAGDVLNCLAGLFRRPLGGPLLSAAALLGCEGRPGSCPALLGARLFIGAYADLAELPRERARLLDRELRRRFREGGCPDGRSGGSPGAAKACFARAAEIVEAARDLLNRELGQSPAGDKPRQYNDNIYSDRRAMFRHTPYALEERLVRAVMRGDERAALRTLLEISRSGEKAVLAPEPLRSAKNSIIGSIAFLARASIRAGVDPEPVFALSDALTRHVEELPSKQEALAYEEKVLLRFIDLVQKRPNQAYSPLVRRTLNYIEARLDKRLFLRDIAAGVYANPNYLSGRFKKETGKPLTGYITLRKIQESAYFVRHTAYPLADIAALYGFSGQSYFIRSFKKVMGRTPGAFRSGPEW
jgi:AraC-like DNA-binding protein